MFSIIHSLGYCIPTQSIDSIDRLNRWIQLVSVMPRDRREKRDVHALDENGMLLCNPRDKEAAHRAEIDDIATADEGAVTCPKCLSLLFARNKARRKGH